MSQNAGASLSCPQISNNPKRQHARDIDAQAQTKKFGSRTLLKTKPRDLP
jgi:hypothetical protein